MGRVIEVHIDGAIVSAIKTETAVAADYLSFIDSLTKALLNDSEGLEKEANMSGRTIKYANFVTFGSIQRVNKEKMTMNKKNYPSAKDISIAASDIVRAAIGILLDANINPTDETLISIFSAASEVVNVSQRSSFCLDSPKA